MLWRTLSLQKSFNCYIFWLYFSLKYPQSEHDVKIYTVSKWHGQNCMNKCSSIFLCSLLPLGLRSSFICEVVFAQCLCNQFFSCQTSPTWHHLRTLSKNNSHSVLMFSSAIFFFFAQPLAQSLPHHKCSEIILSFHISTLFFMSKFLNLILKMDAQTN